MINIDEIKQEIQKLFESKNGKQISKGAGLPYQTVQDLRNGKSSLNDARLRTIEALYNFAMFDEDDLTFEYRDLFKMRVIQDYYNVDVRMERLRTDCYTNQIIVNESVTDKKVENIYIKEINHADIEDEITPEILVAIQEGKAATELALNYFKKELSKMKLY
ncbi:hypothetical protein WKW47_09740 [Staphylococcus nepalensis]|nr:hypothetical protein [Staphylococcus equorum]MDW5471687.1 hypothetical protein [Staphylococcus equorum]